MISGMKATRGVYPYSNDNAPNWDREAPFYEPMTILPAVAMQTTTLRVFPSVIKLPLHHPLPFAKQVATAAVMSGDRFALGVGASWAPEEYAHPAATLFVRRGSAADAALGSPGRYARFEAVGVVRQMFLGRPWIELTRLEPLSQQFTEGSMIHASRAVELMAAGHWGMAAESFERALASDLPARARTELDELRTLCLSRAPRTPPGTKRDGSAGNASGAGGSGRQVPAAQAPPSTKTGES